jgi:hypothetical protein
MRRLAGFLISASIFTASCGSISPLESTAKTDSANEVASGENYQPPFGSKEPEKYHAKIVFAFKWDETDPNFVEQITFVWRDGANRRLDFEIAEGRQISRLEIADGKRFLLVPQRKIYAEISDAASDNFAGTIPEEHSLAHLLYSKPAEAKFQKIGVENVEGKQLTKYLIDFGALREAENATTETVVWIDETSGLPFKTEITAIVDKKPSGAKSVAELRDFKTEVEPQIFAVPSDFRQISVKEIQEYLSKQRRR